MVVRFHSVPDIATQRDYKGAQRGQGYQIKGRPTPPTRQIADDFDAHVGTPQQGVTERPTRARCQSMQRKARPILSRSSNVPWSSSSRP